MRITVTHSFMFVLTITALSSAAIVEVEFSGVITEIVSGTTLDGHVVPGTEFAGMYVYDNTAVDLFPGNSESGHY